MTPSRIEVTIDELVLHGVAPGDRYAIAEALQVELGRLLTDQGVPPGWTREGATAKVDAGTATQNPGGANLGARAAQAIYRGIR
jgi:hypothetical protein